METRHQTSDDQAEEAGVPPVPAVLDSGHGTPRGTLPAGISIRPLESHDRAGLAALFTRLSAESRRRRFLTPKPHLSPRELNYLMAVDHRRHEALAAIDGRDGSIVAVARYVGGTGHSTVADAAVAVADDMQRKGIGTALGRRLVHRARVNGFHVLTATTLWDNRPARLLLRRLGFQACASEGHLIELELDLCAP